MKTNSPDIRIDVPESYSRKLPPTTLSDSEQIKEVPNATNKVRKRVIRGVLKHDTPPSKQD